MENPLQKWGNDTYDVWNMIWQGIGIGLLVGSSEGIVIYFLMKAFGIVDKVAIYG